MNRKFSGIILLCIMAVSCTSSHENVLRMTVVAPGHFHASLLQKNKIDGVCDTVRVFAPAGRELEAYIDAVESYNTRKDSPTSWILDVYDGEDWFDRIPQAGKGDFAVFAGNNGQKTDYICKCVDLGYNILSDKPMAIDEEDYAKLENAYCAAKEKGLVVMDMMTERYDVLNRTVRGIVSREELFGTVCDTVRVEDVHYFCKYVSGKPLTRPEWYFDVKQQGYGIADVTTHFIDLAFWEFFPGTAIPRDETEVLSATMYPTIISEPEYCAVTGATAFPDYLRNYVRNGNLEVLANGCLTFRVLDIPFEISVMWDYAPEDGAADSFRQTVTGTGLKIEILQDATTGYKRQLYLHIPTEAGEKAAASFLAEEFPGTRLICVEGEKYLVDIPDSERLPHEEHFNRVGEYFTTCVREGHAPDWEMENSLTKYYITTHSVALAK